MVAVNQIDSKGIVVQQFPSVYAAGKAFAEALGKNMSTARTNIQQAAQGKTDTAWGYRWQYADVDANVSAHANRESRLSSAGSNARAVESFSLSTGEARRQYPSATVAHSVTGICNTHISACANGHRREAGGVGWRFV